MQRGVERVDGEAEGALNAARAQRARVCDADMLAVHGRPQQWGSAAAAGGDGGSSVGDGGGGSSGSATASAEVFGFN